jgi:hypothetical protein
VHLLYPSSPLRATQPDELYAAELSAVRGEGFHTSLVSFEALQAGSFRATPPLPQGTTALYRGWMLSAGEYELLAAGIRSVGARAFTDLRSYLASHHLPNWYPAIAELTPETRVFPLDADLVSALGALGWSEYFVKDYVKSLKTSSGARITKPEQIANLATEMRRFRGTIEGGFCVRRVESFIPSTEKRYFVVNGVPQAEEDDVPEIVRECASRLASRFYSVDVVERSDGTLRIVEVGDGQVSDLVGWTPKRFASMLAEQFLSAQQTRVGV